MVARVAKDASKKNASPSAATRQDQAHRTNQTQEPYGLAGKFEGHRSNAGLQREFGKISTFAPGEEPSSASMHLQRKIAIGSFNDSLEQEADRVAEHVTRMPDPELSIAPAPSQLSRKCTACEAEEVEKLRRNAAGKAESATDASASVHGAMRSPGRSLDAATRRFFEPRFGYDFSKVRVHLDATAQQSAQDVSADAFTVGHHIVFGAGLFAPETRAGRQLIAHELTHVVQGSATVEASVHQNDQNTGLISIRRQPKNQPQKTLKSEGVDPKDPAAASTATIIDDVLTRNERLRPYIGDSLKGGPKIAAKGKFILEISDSNFEDAFRRAYGMSHSDFVSPDTKGFYDYKKSEIHLRPGTEFGTALHESVHKLASPALYRDFLPLANAISHELGEVLTEGVTAFFTDCILKDEGLPNFNDSYRSQKKKAESLIAASDSDGFDLMAKFNFKGNIIDIGQKWGFTIHTTVDRPGVVRPDFEKFRKDVLNKMNQAI